MGIWEGFKSHLVTWSIEKCFCCHLDENKPGRAVALGDADLVLAAPTVFFKTKHGDPSPAKGFCSTDGDRSSDAKLFYSLGCYYS